MPFPARIEESGVPFFSQMQTLADVDVPDDDAVDPVDLLDALDSNTRDSILYKRDNIDTVTVETLQTWFEEECATLNTSQEKLLLSKLLVNPNPHRLQASVAFFNIMLEEHKGFFSDVDNVYAGLYDPLDATSLEEELGRRLTRDIVDADASQSLLMKSFHSSAPERKMRKPRTKSPSSPYSIQCPLPQGMETQHSRPSSRQRSLSRMSDDASSRSASSRYHDTFTPSEIISFQFEDPEDTSESGNVTVLFLHASADAEDTEPCSYIMFSDRQYNVAVKKTTDSRLSKFEPCSLCSACYKTDGHAGDCLAFNITPFDHSGTQVFTAVDSIHKSNIWRGEDGLEHFFKQYKADSCAVQGTRHMRSIAMGDHNISFPFAFDENWMHNIFVATQDENYIAYLCRFASPPRNGKKANNQVDMRSGCKIADPKITKHYDKNGTMRSLLNSFNPAYVANHNATHKKPLTLIPKDAMMKLWKTVWENRDQDDAQPTKKDEDQQPIKTDE